jgi:ADP-ribosyl-[dinitrogen reductase] hydrolase
MSPTARLYEAPRVPSPEMQDKYRGCLLGGAVGDALGAPVEFMRRSEILSMFGRNGIKDYASAYGRIGAVTDDTQMTLFTAEGMLRAYVQGQLRGICHAPGVIYRAYLRWLFTQGYAGPARKPNLDGWLITNRELFAHRAPGNTCLSALQAPIIGDRAANDSKGCGGVMRVAPVGMLFARLMDGPNDESQLQRCFDMAVDAAALTHGHPTGQLTAGVFASVVALLHKGVPLRPAIQRALAILARSPNHQETHGAITAALQLADERPNEAEALELLGGGWVAEEALAIAFYCALSAEDFKSGVLLAVNHSGDSDSTGSIAGNLLGASLGLQQIPENWIESLELRDVIASVADDLATFADWQTNNPEDEYYFERYPGV